MDLVPREGSGELNSPSLSTLGSQVFISCYSLLVQPLEVSICNHDSGFFFTGLLGTPPKHASVNQTTHLLRRSFDLSGMPRPGRHRSIRVGEVNILWHHLQLRFHSALFHGMPIRVPEHVLCPA
jgi:hypothetical protein